MKNEAAIFLLAVQFLTRLPVPTARFYSPERLNEAARYYPMVGFLIGAICAAIYWVLGFLFPHVLALVLAIAAGLLLTGGFHEDGLADTFDGLGGGQTRDQTLEIMKDSRLGTYGSLALILALAIKFASLASMPESWIIVALIAAHGLSRLSSVIVIATSSYARTEGTAKPVASGISSFGLMVATLSGIAGLAATAYYIPVPAIGAAVLGLILGQFAMRLLFERKLGGYTGDTLGAVQQVSEIGFYLGLVAWLS